MKSETLFCKIETDESLMESKQHGSIDFPFKFYWEAMSMYDFNCMDWHWHTELEFVYVESGEVSIWINEEVVSLTAGNGIFINSRALHRLHSERDAVIPNFLFLPVFISPSDSLIYHRYVHPIISSAFSFQKFEETVPWQANVLSSMREIIHLNCEDQSSPFQISILVQQLWLLLADHIQLPDVPGSSVSSHARLQLMMEFIQNNYADELLLDDIAQAAHVSKSTALYLFRNILQITPVNYLILYRLKQAAVRLSKTEQKISEISQDVGFENVDHFCRTFKKHYGVTPTEYRKGKRSEH